MAQLQLTRQKVKLTHIDLQSQGKENDEKTIPVKLKFYFEDFNTWLAHIHPRLSAALYMQGDDAQESMLDAEASRTKRVFGDLLEQVNLSTQLKGATGAIFHGVKPSEIPIQGADVGGFKVVLMEGGTVGVSFHVSTRFPSKAIQTLAELQQTEMAISLAMAQSDLEGMDE